MSLSFGGKDSYANLLSDATFITRVPNLGAMSFPFLWRDIFRRFYNCLSKNLTSIKNVVTSAKKNISPR